MRVDEAKSTVPFDELGLKDNSLNAAQPSVFILFSCDRADNEARIEAVTSSREVANRWSIHYGNYHEEYKLDCLDEIRYAIKPVTSE